MKKYKEQSNNQLMAEVINLKAEHEAIKNRILSELDNLELVDTKFEEINRILEERIKGVK